MPSTIFVPQSSVMNWIMSCCILVEIQEMYHLHKYDIQTLDVSIKNRSRILAIDGYNESLDLVPIAYMWALYELRKSRDSFLEEKEDHIIMKWVIHKEKRFLTRLPLKHNNQDHCWFN